MARSTAYHTVLMPVFKGRTSWFEAIARVGATALINGQQPRGY